MAEDLYYVVVNKEEQFSVWQKDRSLPAGWDHIGEPATKQECLQRIDELWTDMTPLSVRKFLKDYAQRGNDDGIQ